MRKAIIDCGAYNGCSVLKLLKVIEDFSEYEVYCFEILPKFNKILCNMQNMMKNVHYVNKAVWTKDDNLPFYLSTISDDGNSIFSTKTSNKIDTLNPIMVETIDFSQWLLSTFDESYNIILKMDIEGAEYDVLEKMIRDNSIARVSKLYVEWHHFKISDISEARHKALIKALKDRNIDIHVWDSLEFKEQANMIFT